MKRIHAAMLAALVVTTCPGAVFAHAVGVSCTVRGDKVEVEAYYDNDDPAIKAKVLVLNAKEEIVASGLTDEKGRWVFSKPEPGKFEVRLDAGAGHRKTTMLTVPRVVNAAIPEEITRTSATSERVKFTQVPWFETLIGLAVIGGGCAMLLIVARLRAATRVRSPEANRQT